MLMRSDSGLCGQSLLAPAWRLPTLLAAPSKLMDGLLLPSLPAAPYRVYGLSSEVHCACRRGEGLRAGQLLQHLAPLLHVRRPRRHLLHQAPPGERVHVAFPLHFSAASSPSACPEASSGAQPRLRSLLGAGLRVNPMAV